jgi:hypothetical protein
MNFIKNLQGLEHLVKNPQPLGCLPKLINKNQISDPQKSKPAGYKNVNSSSMQINR